MFLREPQLQKKQPEKTPAALDHVHLCLLPPALSPHRVSRVAAGSVNTVQPSHPDPSLPCLDPAQSKPAHHPPTLTNAVIVWFLSSAAAEVDGFLRDQVPAGRYLDVRGCGRTRGTADPEPDLLE